MGEGIHLVSIPSLMVKNPILDPKFSTLKPVFSEKEKDLGLYGDSNPTTEKQMGKKMEYEVDTRSM